MIHVLSYYFIILSIFFFYVNQRKENVCLLYVVKKKRANVSPLKCYSFIYLILHFVIFREMLLDMGQIISDKKYN
jgi:hypothetical protein